MEKFFTLILLFFLIISSGGCMVARPNCDPINGNFFYGPQIGYGASNFYGEDTYQDYKMLGSGTLGAYMYWAMFQNYPLLGLRSGLLYDQYGSRLNYGGDGMNFKGRDRVSYFTVPLMLNYMAFNNFAFELGPTFSFLHGARQVTEFDGHRTINKNKNGFNKAILGLTLAAMYMHQSGITPYLQYNRSLSSLFESDSNVQFYHGRFSIGFYYRLNNLLYRD